MSGFIGNDGSGLIGGLNPSGVVQGAIVDSAGRMITTNQILQLILAGQGFSATTGVLSSATNGNLQGAMGLFNNSTAKNILIYSILLSVSNNAFDSRLNLHTADPAFGSAITPVNLLGGAGGAASLATVSAVANNFAASAAIVGNSVMAGGAGANAINEWLQSGACILLPKSVASAIALYSKMVTAGQSFVATMRWVEYV